MTSPYAGKPVSAWPGITEHLVSRHPLKKKELVSTVLRAWELIFKKSVIGGLLHIGVDLFPQPQILGDFLHELVPLILERRYPGQWRRDRAANEKDMFYEPDDSFSVEIKTSSSRRGIFGNRSFSQESKARPEKKAKSGYYLTINFPPVHKLRRVEPITLIRFGWLDHADWEGQEAASGQQASLKTEALKYKLVTLYPEEEGPTEVMKTHSK
jgi:hypothetical protein